MAKYNWIELEKEYVLGEYKSVSTFLKDKNIPRSQTAIKNTKGWNKKRAQKSSETAQKTIEKTIEKQSENDSKRCVKINDVANKLLIKIADATEELNKNMDMFGTIHEGIVDRADIKKLTSALKDLNDILKNNESEKNNDGVLNELIGALKDVKKD